MQSRGTLTLTLSLLRRERGTFGGSVSGSSNRDPRQVRTSSPRSERGEDQGEGRLRLHTYGLLEFASAPNTIALSAPFDGVTKKRQRPDHRGQQIFDWHQPEESPVRMGTRQFRSLIHRGEDPRQPDRQHEKQRLGQKFDLDGDRRGHSADNRRVGGFAG